MMNSCVVLDTNAVCDILACSGIRCMDSLRKPIRLQSVPFYIRRQFMQDVIKGKVWPSDTNGYSEMGELYFGVQYYEEPTMEYRSIAVWVRNADDSLLAQAVQGVQDYCAGVRRNEKEDS